MLIEARMVRKWGEESDIIEAARQSTEGTFRGWEKDEKLLRYMFMHDHTSPFEFVGAVFECRAPLFVLGQVVRHRTLKFNVFSMRYSKAKGVYYKPPVWREQAKSNHQGSAGPVDIDQVDLDVVYENAVDHAFDAYESLLAAGVSKEQARNVLPQSTMTQWRMGGDLHNLLKFLRLRLAAPVQEETRQLALDIALNIQQAFPRTFALFLEKEKDGFEIGCQEALCKEDHEEDRQEELWGDAGP